MARRAVPTNFPLPLWERVRGGGIIDSNYQTKKNEEKRILNGHPWVFSNEIEGFPSHIEPGAIVDIEDYKGRFIGRGYLIPAL